MAERLKVEAAGRGGEMSSGCRLAAARGWTVGISFEPLPEIEFKVLRIRVKCQRGQPGDLFRLA